MSVCLEVEGAVASLALPSGHVTVVDAADLPLIQPYRWFIRESRGKLYVRGYRIGNSRQQNAYLHRVLLGVDAEVDHINGDGLDNRRANLRPATHAQNLANMSGRGGSSPYKGVIWDQQAGAWAARIKVDGRRRRLGTYADPQDAARAYDAAATEAWGEYAWLNFPAVVRP